MTLFYLFRSSRTKLSKASSSSVHLLLVFSSILMKFSFSFGRFHNRNFMISCMVGILVYYICGLYAKRYALVSIFTKCLTGRKGVKSASHPQLGNGKLSIFRVKNRTSQQLNFQHKCVHLNSNLRRISRKILNPQNSTAVYIITCKFTHEDFIRGIDT